MKNLKHSLLLLLSICSSCELVLDIGDDLDYQGRLVIGCILEPDSLITVSVAKTNFILDEPGFEEPQASQVTDALVRVFEDEVLLGETSESFSPEYESFAIYSFPFSASAGRTYRVEVEKSGYPLASAEESISTDEPIWEVLDIEMEGFYDEYGGWGDLDFTLKIEDNIGEDFYQVVSFTEFKVPYYLQTDTGTFETDSLVTRRSNHYLRTTSLAVEEYLQSENVFDDRLFNGSSLNMRFETNFWFDSRDYYDADPKIVIKVNRLSEAYYNYLTTTELQQWLDGDPFAEPVQIYSNVEGGLGFLGSFNATVVEVPIEETP